MGDRLRGFSMRFEDSGVGESNIALAGAEDLGSAGDLLVEADESKMNGRECGQKSVDLLLLRVGRPD